MAWVICLIYFTNNVGCLEEVREDGLLHNTVNITASSD